MDLSQQLFQTFVFGDPCLYLGKEVLGDVHGAGLVPRALAGHVLAAVQRTAVMTAAPGLAAAVGVSMQGGGQHRRRGAKLLQSAVEHAANLRRVVRNAHGRTPSYSRNVCVRPDCWPASRPLPWFRCEHRRPTGETAEKRRPQVDDLSDQLRFAHQCTHPRAAKRHEPRERRGRVVAFRGPRVRAVVRESKVIGQLVNMRPAFLSGLALRATVLMPEALMTRHLADVAARSAFVLPRYRDMAAV